MSRIPLKIPCDRRFCLFNTRTHRIDRIMPEGTSLEGAMMDRDCTVGDIQDLTLCVIQTNRAVVKISDKGDVGKRPVFHIPLVTEL